MRFPELFIKPSVDEILLNLKEEQVSLTTVINYTTTINMCELQETAEREVLIGLLHLYRIYRFTVDTSLDSPSQVTRLKNLL